MIMMTVMMMMMMMMINSRFCKMVDLRNYIKLYSEPGLLPEASTVKNLKRKESRI